MRAVAKILIDFDVADSIEGRRVLRDLVDRVAPALPENGHVREFKMTEDGTGRLIEKADIE